VMIQKIIHSDLSRQVVGQLPHRINRDIIFIFSKLNDAERCLDTDQKSAFTKLNNTMNINTNHRLDLSRRHYKHKKGKLIMASNVA
jgi:hypothetical protein